MYSVNCKACEETNATSRVVCYCKDCKEYLCQQHLDEHKAFRFTRNHVTTSVSEGIGRKKEIHYGNQRYSNLLEIPQVKSTRSALMNDPMEKMSDELQIQMNINQYGTGKQRKSPGKPQYINVGSDSITIEWDEPEKLSGSDTYQLSYKMIDMPDSKWKSVSTELKQPRATMRDLKSDTTFVFRVRVLFDDEEGPYSPISDPAKTIESPACRIKDSATIIEHCVPELRALPITQIRNSENAAAMTQKFELGTMSKNFKGKEKTIMLVGETGTGKSTMLDGMVNYVLGVNWDDPFRFTIVHLEDDEKKKKGNQALSQTDWITSYTLYPEKGGRIDYTLTIIDTPGFWDTRGQKRDKKVVEQIHQLFSSRDEKGVLGIDAVCFLIKAADAKLTHTQRYMFESIMALFGKDVEKNMCSLITFADGQTSPVLAALKESKLPFGKSFTFNNSGLFCKNTDLGPSSLSRIYWNMGIQSFRGFFDNVGLMHTTSLAQTKDVLDTRKQLENTIQNLLPMVDVGLSKLASVRREIKFIQQHNLDIEQNKDFLIPIENPKIIKHYTSPGQYVNNCLRCNFTCHQDCCIPDDDNMKYCAAMGGSQNNCCECSGKCHWTQHKSMGFYWELKVDITYEPCLQKKDKYERACREKLTREGRVKKMQMEIQDLREEITDMMEKITHCNNRLKEIAIRPNPLSLVGHIDLLIESEKSQKKRGFEDRIKELELYKKEAQYGLNFQQEV